MNIKNLEKLIYERHCKNDPVILGIVSILKSQAKEIEKLKLNKSN